MCLQIYKPSQEMLLPDTKPEACATPQRSADFIFQPFLTTPWLSQSYPIGTGTRSRGAPTRKGSPTAPGHLCCGSTTPPAPSGLTHFKEREKSFLLVSLLRTK